MKRILLLAASVGMLAPLAAQPSAGPKMLRTPNAPQKNMVLQKPSQGFFTRSEADPEAVIFGYCTGMNTSLGVPGYTIEGAMEIPELLSEQWKGNQVTAINVGFGQTESMIVYVYVTKTLTGETEIIQPTKLTTPHAFNRVELTTPYEIDGEPFYIGYQALCNYATDFPMGVDFNTDFYSPYGDLCALNNEWFDIGYMYGNVSIQMEMKGENLPLNNAAVTNIYVPPLVQKGEVFEGGFLVRNDGVDPVQKIEYSFNISGGTSHSGEYVFPNPIVSGSFDWVRFEDLQCNVTSEHAEATAVISSVNGGPAVSLGVTSIALTLNFICAAETYQQNALVEEFTGTWCAFCPRGIVGMAYMEENYADKGFIGVAVHYNDAMQNPSYLTINAAYSEGSWPSAVMNRVSYFDPSIATLEDYYKMTVAQPAVAQISIDKAEYVKESNTVEINSSTVFGVSVPDANYKLAFAIAENNVGPYSQKNGFSGAAPGTQNYLQGWSMLGSTVSTMYNEVGRIIVDPFGLDDSLPSNIEELTQYPYSVSIPVSSEWNLNNCFVVAMILDDKKENVVNSAKLPEIANAAAGVEGIENDIENHFKVYNPQGIKVLDTDDASQIGSLPSGIYIVNGKKVFVK